MLSFFGESRKDYNDDELKEIWNKAIVAKNKNKEPILNKRFDVFGALMYFEKYGKRDSEFGWEVDHIDENKDNNDKSNLRPIFWRNNTARNAFNHNYYSYDFDLKKNIVNEK